MELNELREEIDLVDDEILTAFLKRMELSEQVAEYKKANGIPLINRTRERQIMSDVMAKAGKDEQYAFQLFSMLFELSKARQSALISGDSAVGRQIKAAAANGGAVFPQTGTVACQGIEGANSQVACDRLLPRGNIMYVRSFESVFDAVESGLCRFGVLPIENSSTGSVRAVYDLLREKNFSIVRSARLCIHHELMAKKGTKLSDVKEIYSHEQAIGQCSGFLSTLQGVKIIPCANTATAAQTVAESDGACAAISSHPCAALYGLDVLESNIQNNDNNYTRFICIARDPVIYAGANRISLIVDTADTPGALHSILARLAAVGVNMSKLESCPVTGQNFEFIFYIEIEASVLEPGVLPMLEDLERACAAFRFLGSYQEV